MMLGGGGSVSPTENQEITGYVLLEGAIAKERADAGGELCKREK